MFIIGIIFAVAVALIACKIGGLSAFAELDITVISSTQDFFSGILMAFCFSLVGFADDYIKVVKRNLGLTEIEKTIPQVLIIGAYFASLVISESTSMYIPFYGKVAFDSVPGIIFFCLFGVCVTTAQSMPLTLLTVSTVFAEVLQFPSVLPLPLWQRFRQNTSVGILGAALFYERCNAGYVIWNHYPQRL